MRIRRAVTVFVVATFTAATGAVAAAVAVNATAATTACSVTYSVTSQWPGGFGASVSLTNLADPLTSWTLTWSFGAGQQVTQAWNATVAQSGAQVTAVNASYDGSIATNASTSFGFNASWNNTSNPTPGSFALNGVTCTGTTQPTPSPSPTTSPGVHTMGYIGCSMGENTAQGYAADGGTRMWGGYATGGDVVHPRTVPRPGSTPSWPPPRSTSSASTPGSPARRRPPHEHPTSANSHSLSQPDNQTISHIQPTGSYRSRLTC